MMRTSSISPLFNIRAEGAGEYNTFCILHKSSGIIFSHLHKLKAPSTPHDYKKGKKLITVMKKKLCV